MSPTFWNLLGLKDPAKVRGPKRLGRHVLFKVQLNIVQNVKVLVSSASEQSVAKQYLAKVIE